MFGKADAIAAALLVLTALAVSAEDILFEENEAQTFFSKQESMVRRLDQSQGYPPRYRPNPRFRKAEDVKLPSGERHGDSTGDRTLIFRKARSPEGAIMVDRTNGKALADTTILRTSYQPEVQLRTEVIKENARGSIVNTRKRGLFAGIEGVFAKIARKLGSMGDSLQSVRAAKDTHGTKTVSSNNSLDTKINQTSMNTGTIAINPAIDQVSSNDFTAKEPWSSRLSEDQKLTTGSSNIRHGNLLSRSSICDHFNCNWASPKKPNVDRSVSITGAAKNIEIRETVSQSLESEDGRTKVNADAYRNNLGEEGGDFKVAHSFNDRTSLNGRANGNNRGDFNGDVDVTHSFNEHTSLYAHAYASNPEDLGGDLAVTHNFNDRTSLNAGINGNNQGDLGGDLSIAHSFNDRTSLNGRAYANNQGELEGDFSVRHRINDVTSVDGHAHANNQRGLNGDLGVTHSFNNRTSFSSRVYANNQRDLKADLSITHNLNDRTSLNAAMRGNNLGDLSGNLNIAHSLNHLTSLNGRVFTNNQGKSGGDFGIRRQLSDRTSLNAEASGNNYGEHEGKLGIEHQFSDSTSIAAGAHADHQGNIGVGLSITGTFQRRR